MNLSKEDAEPLLRFAMKNNNTSLTKVASELDLAPVTIRKWKRGTNLPESGNLAKLEKFFRGEVHVCPWCSEAFQPHDSKQKFCSDNCKDNYEDFHPTYEIKKNFKIPKIEKKCSYCGENFVGATSSKYCSEKCKRLASTNPDYYAVFYRDHFRCRYCGKTPADNIRLTIDHVYPKSRGGEEDKFNLVTACQKCNSHKGATLWKEELIKEIWWQNKKLEETSKIKGYEEMKKEFKEEYPDIKMPNLKGGKNHQN